MPEIELDTIRANKITIFFRNKIFLHLIGTVQVFTPVGTTNFYIIDTLILLLLYFKNIDTYSIYLNNIINQLFCQNGKNIPIICKKSYS